MSQPLHRPLLSPPVRTHTVALLDAWGGWTWACATTKVLSDESPMASQTGPIDAEPRDDDPDEPTEEIPLSDVIELGVAPDREDWDEEFVLSARA